MRIRVFAILVMVCAHGCYKPSRCVEGDFTHLAGSARPKSHAEGERDWLQDARSCRIGRYQIVGPRDNRAHALMVLEDGIREPVLYVESDALLIPQPRYQARVFLAGRDGNGRFNSLRYSVHDPLRDADLSLTDSELDGQPDFRETFFRSSGARVSEAWIGDAWRMRVKRGDQDGYFLNGEFWSESELESRTEAMP